MVCYLGVGTGPLYPRRMRMVCACALLYKSGCDKFACDTVPSSPCLTAASTSCALCALFLQVDGPARFKRVSGSSIGGGTYWGLCRLLTQAGSYDESLHMASKGDSEKVDMLVGDIYGRGYSKFQLSSNTLASSFGKIGGMAAPKGPDAGVGEEDLARALLVMITMNIGQVGVFKVYL